MSGTANRPLARAIARELKRSLVPVEIRRFPNQETYVRIKADLAGADVFLIQSLSEPANDHLLELFLLADAARRAGAARLTAVVTYMGYARQDRVCLPGEPVSIAVLAATLKAVGVMSAIVLDPHSSAVREQLTEQGIEYHRVSALPIFTEYLGQHHKLNLRVVSPDKGGADRAKGYADCLTPSEPPLVLAKQRLSHSEVKISELPDAVSEICLLVDDILATGGTLVRAAEILKKRGARHIWAAATHGEFIGDARKKLKDSSIEKILITNSIRIPRRRYPRQVEVQDISPLFAQAIREFHAS